MVRINLTIAPLPAQERGASGSAHVAARRKVQRGTRGGSAARGTACPAEPPKDDVATAPGGKVTFEEHQQLKPHINSHAANGTHKADSAGERSLKRTGSTLSASVLMAASQGTLPPEKSREADDAGLHHATPATIDSSATGDALTDAERFALLAVYYSRRLPGAHGPDDGEPEDAPPTKQHLAHASGISQRVSAPAGSYLLATVTTSAGVAPPVNAGGTPITTFAMLHEVLQICGLPCPDEPVRTHAPFLLVSPQSGHHGRVLSAAEFLAIASDVKRDMQSVAAHRELTLHHRQSRRGRGKSSRTQRLSGVAALFMSGIVVDEDGGVSDSSESSDESPGNSPARRATSPALTKSSLARLLRSSGAGGANGEAGGLIGTGPAARARLALIAERLRPACDLVNASFHALHTLPAGAADPEAATILLQLGDPASSAAPTPANSKSRAPDVTQPAGAEHTCPATASPISDATSLRHAEATQPDAVPEMSGDVATVLAASWGVLEAAQVSAARDAVDGLDDTHVPVPLITEACKRYAAAAAAASGSADDGGGCVHGITPRANRSVRSQRSPSTTPRRRQSHMRRPSAAFGRSLAGLLGGGAGAVAASGLEVDELLAGVTITSLAVGPVLEALHQAGFGFDRAVVEHALVTEHGTRLEEQPHLSANPSRSSFGAGALGASSSFRLRSSSSNPTTPGAGLVSLEAQHTQANMEPLTAATAYVPCVLLTELAMVLADDDNDEAGEGQEDPEVHNAALDGALQMAIHAVPQGSQYQISTHPLGGVDSHHDHHNHSGPSPDSISGSPGVLVHAPQTMPQPWSFGSPSIAHAATRTSNSSTTDASPAAASISGPASTKATGPGQGSASNYSLAGTVTGASHVRRGSTTILHDDPAPGASDTPLAHSGAQRRRSFADGAGSEGERSRRGSDAASLTNVDARTQGGASSGLGGGSRQVVGGNGAPSLMRTASMVSSATRSRRGNMRSTLLAHKVAAVSVLAHRPKKTANAAGGAGPGGGRRGSIAQAATDYLPPCDVCEMKYRDFRVTPKLRTRPDDTPQFVRCPSAGSRFLESFERNYRRPDHEVADNSPTRASRLRETCGRFKAGTLRDRDAAVTTEVGCIPPRAATPGPTPDVPGLTDADPLSVVSSTFPQQSSLKQQQHSGAVRQRSPASPLSRNGDSSTMTEAAMARRSSPASSTRHHSRRQSGSQRPGSASVKRDSSRAGNVALAPREKSRPYSYTPYFGQSLMPQVPSQGGKGVWAPRMDKGDFAAVLRKEIAVLKADWARRT